MLIETVIDAPTLWLVSLCHHSGRLQHRLYLLCIWFNQEATRFEQWGKSFAQIMLVQKYFDERGQDERVSHIVVMGIGEPFDNYKNVLSFVRTVNDDKGLAIGARHITVSTSGLAHKIRDFANEGVQVNLAVSLHAPKQ